MLFTCGSSFKSVAWSHICLSQRVLPLLSGCCAGGAPSCTLPPSARWYMGSGLISISCQHIGRQLKPEKHQPMFFSFVCFCHVKFKSQILLLFKLVYLQSKCYFKVSLAFWFKRLKVWGGCVRLTFLIERLVFIFKKKGSLSIRTVAGKVCHSFT